MKNKEILEWLSKYVDDVTEIIIKNDIIYLVVNNRKIGMITYQKI